MEYTQITLDDWMSMKEGLKKDLIGVQESFVRIGFKLRKIEEQQLYKQDGYKTITEFAKAEYGLNNTTVSRFMAINRKYSVDGYSDRLCPEFANLGSSKLSEMLSLPDQDLTMIQPEATREGIRELKQFNREKPPEVPDDLKVIIEKFFEVNQETLNDVYSSEAYETEEVEKLIEIVNPSGNKTFRNGIYFLMMYEKEIKVKKFGQTPETMSWAEFFTVMRDIFDQSAAGENTWQKHFGGDDGEEDAESPMVEEEPKREVQLDTGINERRTDPPRSGANDGTDHTQTTPTDDKNHGEEEALETEILEGEVVDTEEAEEEMEEETIEEPSTLPENFAPAQKSAEILESDAPDETENGENCGVAETGIIEPETAAAAGEENEETEPCSEVMNAPDVIDKSFCTRKDYMDTLTVYGMAIYMAEEYERHTLKASSLACPSELEKWLLQEVDENGREIERGGKS